MTTTRHTSKHTTADATRSVRMYAIGFALSILLTIAAFWFSYSSGTLAAALIVFAACIQLFVQLTFFLHLGSKTTPASWRVMFAIALLIVGILVGGTLWIMHNLDRLHMMPITNSDLYEHGQAAPQNEKY